MDRINYIRVHSRLSYNNINCDNISFTWNNGMITSFELNSYENIYLRMLADNTILVDVNNIILHTSNGKLLNSNFDVIYDDYKQHIDEINEYLYVLNLLFKEASLAIYYIDITECTKFKFESIRINEYIYYHNSYIVLDKITNINNPISVYEFEKETSESIIRLTDGWTIKSRMRSIIMCLECVEALNIINEFGFNGYFDTIVKKPIMVKSARF